MRSENSRIDYGTVASWHGGIVADLRNALAALAILSLLAGCASTGGSIGHRKMRGEEIFTLSAEADKAYRESRWLDAARQYQLLTEKVPNDAWAWFRLGNVHARQGNYDLAISAYESSLERNPRQAKPWFNLSTAYLLNARLAMMRAREHMNPDDPAAALIDQRLETLQGIIHQRIEDDINAGT